MLANGAMVISLDFELHWGVRDKRTIESYRENLLGVREVVPLMLDVFERYGIAATWSTVGFLFFETKENMLRCLPDMRPQYTNPKFSPYDEVTKVGENEEEDPYHFAPSLIKLIQTYERQEIGTHTFSHYYCLEEGETIEAFKADITAAKRAALPYGIELKSIIFPRNQYSDEHVRVCERLGVLSYRGNERSELYRPRSEAGETRWRRLGRLADAYINLSGHNTTPWEEVAKTFPYNIPSSRFLRPYHPKLRLLDGLRLRRIKQDMTYAAKHGSIFHLWWHPHNFGRHLDESIAFLEEILKHHQYLNERYGFESLNMTEITERLMEARWAYETEINHASR